MGVAEEIGGDDLLVGVAQDSLEGSLGGLLDLSLDLIVAGTLAQADGKIHHGHIGSGHAESHA